MYYTSSEAEIQGYTVQFLYNLMYNKCKCAFDVCIHVFTCTPGSLMFPKAMCQYLTLQLCVCTVVGEDCLACGC